MAHYKHSVCILMLAFAFTSCDFDDVLDTTDVVYDLVMCGNGQLDYGEECDDGNTISGDGCSYDCKKETPSSNCPEEGECRKAAS